MKTHVKGLQDISVFCQKDSCQEPATYLFQTGNDSIAAYCKSHAEGEADRTGIELPIVVAKLLYAGW